MKIVYNGHYGAMNTGDDAFVEVASWGTQKFWGANDHCFLASKIPIVQNKKAQYYFPYQNKFSFVKAISKVTKADVFLSAGGSTLYKNIGLKDLRYYAGLKKSLNSDSQIGAIGVSIGPFKSLQDEKSVVSYLKKLDFLSLRDQRSFDVAQSFDLNCKPINAFDLAALLPDIYKLDIRKSVSSKKKVIGISVCNYESYIQGDLDNEKRRNKFIIAVLASLSDLDRELELKFLKFNGDPKIGDGLLTDYFVNELKKYTNLTLTVVDYFKETREMYEVIHNCDLIISTRMHASIFACFANTPFLLVEYHKKCTDFLESVGQDSTYRLHDGEVEVTQVTGVISEILNGNYTQPSKRAQAKSKSLLNFTETLL